MSEPRIFVLARDGWEEPLEYYERRNGEPFDPCHRDHAMEIAPGVHVAILGTGDMMLTDGRQVVRIVRGAKVAVWCDG